MLIIYFFTFRVSVDSTLYLAGGEFPDGSASREMWRYDPCFDSWMEMAPMNVARSELGRTASVLRFQEGVFIQSPEPGYFFVCFLFMKRSTKY